MSLNFSEKAIRILQIVAILMAAVLVIGVAVAIFGGEKDSTPSGGGGGSGAVGSNTETKEETEAETYVPSEGDPECVHTMNNGEEKIKATCGKEGTMVFTCTKCGKTETEMISPTGNHTYKLAKVSDTHHKNVCQVCYEETDPMEHTLTTATRAATCTVSGSVVHSCPCGYSTTESIPALGHLIVNWSDYGNGSQHYGECSRSGCDSADYASHNYGEPVVVEATCFSTGRSTKYCEDCGRSSSTTIPIVAHNYELVEDECVASTCSSTGVDKYECTREGCSNVYTETVAKLEHSLVEDHVTSSTCLVTGERVMNCENCSYEVSEALPLGDHVYSRSTVVAGSCTVKEQYKYTCSVCNHSYTSVSTYDHSYGPGGECTKCGAIRGQN